MDKLNALLRPAWGSEKWIAEGWQQITAEEQELIQARVDELFKDGLPFELKHDKLFYIYSFSLLAQLEVLAIQVPLKFELKLSNPVFRQQLHAQLLDEIFHGIVFTKIVYMLCAPYAMPPAYNEDIEILCNFIRHEDCPKVALMLLNLIAEGWIEEIFHCMHQRDIAPKVFATIIADERRHVSEADLYRDVGIPDMNIVEEKLAYIEELLLNNVFLQYKYSSAFALLLGTEGMIAFLQALDKKHSEQLKKIKLQPSESWKTSMQVAYDLLPYVQDYARKSHPLPFSPIRKVLMTQWKNPSDPSMVGEFNLNISCLDFFNKAFPPETITVLLLQAVSLGLTTDPTFRSYLSHCQLYVTDESYTGLVVKLPGCGDHMGTIIFENCHLLSIRQLSAKIRNILKMMVFCYKKREQLEKSYPDLASVFDQTIEEIASGVYPYPMPGNSVTSVSNIGFCGYTRAKSPLRTNEALKFTLLAVDRKMVWNQNSRAFEEQDILPVSISADHRIFDGNLRIPRLIQQCFDQVFAKMQQSSATELEQNAVDPDQNKQLQYIINRLLQTNLGLAYKALALLQTVWIDFIDIDQIMSHELVRDFSQVP